MNLRTLNKVRRRAYRLARRKFFAGMARWVFGDVPLERRLLTYKCTYPGMPKRIYAEIRNRPFGDFFYSDPADIVREKRMRTPAPWEMEVLK